MWEVRTNLTESGPGGPSDPHMVQLTLSAQAGRIIVTISQTTSEVASSDSLTAMKRIQVVVTGRLRQFPGPREWRSVDVGGATAAKGSAAEEHDCSGRLRFGRVMTAGTSPAKIIDNFASDLSNSIPGFEPRLENGMTLPGEGGFSSRDFQSELVSLFTCRGKSRS